MGLKLPASLVPLLLGAFVPASHTTPLHMGGVLLSRTGKNKGNGKELRNKRLRHTRALEARAR
jgi:hypothetical protein